MTEETRDVLLVASPPAPKLPAHRPSSYSAELLDKICDARADGKELDEIFGTEGFPSKRTFYRWKDDHPEFAAEFDRATRCKDEMFGERCVREILAIVDDSSNDHKDRPTDTGLPVRVLDPEAIARSRLRADKRQWLLEKILPERFGDGPRALVAPNGASPEGLPGDNARTVNPKPNEDDPLVLTLRAFSRVIDVTPIKTPSS